MKERKKKISFTITTVKGLVDTQRDTNKTDRCEEKPEGGNTKPEGGNTKARNSFQFLKYIFLGKVFLYMAGSRHIERQV